MCVCVCEREREREREMLYGGKVMKKNKPLGVCSGIIHSNPQPRMLTFPGNRDMF